MTNTPPSWYYADASNQPVGPVTTEQLQFLLQSSTIALDTLVIQEGGTEWQPLNTIISLAPPVTPPAPLPQKETNVKQGALIGGIACFALGVWLMHASLWSFFFYGPLFLVSFILSIVAMSQRRVVGGIILLLATLVVPAILGLYSFSSGLSDALTRTHPSPTASPSITKLPDLPTPDELVASRGGTSSKSSLSVTPTPEPSQPKYPQLEEKNGFSEPEQPAQIANEDAFKETVLVSKKKATALYPDLAVAGSALNIEFVARFNRYQIRKKEFFKESDWPLRLAKEITDEGTPSASSSAARAQAHSVRLAVQSLIVKKVAADGLFGKSNEFRYFFATRNMGTTPFKGTIEITLLNRKGGVGRSDTFDCNILPGTQAQNYVQSRMGPGNHDSDYSVAAFSYVAKIDSTEVAKGKGAVSTSFENLTSE